MMSILWFCVRCSISCVLFLRPFMLICRMFSVLVCRGFVVFVFFCVGFVFWFWGWGPRNPPIPPPEQNCRWGWGVWLRLRRWCGRRVVNCCGWCVLRVLGAEVRVCVL